MLLGELTWEAYWEYLQVERKVKDTPKNKYAYHSRFNSFKHAFQGKEFSRANFRTFVFSLINAGSKESHINKYITMAIHIDKVLETNVLDGFTRFKEIPPENIILSPEQITKLLDAKLPYKRYGNELNKRNYIAIQFLFATACRPDEMQKLQWNDVRLAPSPHVIFRDTKSRENRTVYIKQSLYDMLQKDVPRYGSEVFATRNGKQFCTTEFNRTLKILAKNAGFSEEIQEISMYTFRRSRATYLARYIDPFLLAKILGHKDIKNTMKYYTPSLNQLVNAAHNNPLQFDKAETEYTAAVVKELVEKMCIPSKYNTIFKEGENGGFSIEVSPVKNI